MNLTLSIYLFIICMDTYIFSDALVCFFSALTFLKDSEISSQKLRANDLRESDKHCSPISSLQLSYLGLLAKHKMSFMVALLHFMI